MRERTAHLEEQPGKKWTKEVASQVLTNDVQEIII